MGQDMKPYVSSVGIAALIEQASRRIHSISFAEGLYPAQWMALRYFSEAPPSSRTTANLARFQGMSLGPVARTIRTLVEKGLLARVANPTSRRADLITVTAAGQALFEHDPLIAISATIETLPMDQREALASAMKILVHDLLLRQNPAEFGQSEDDEQEI